MVASAIRPVSPMPPAVAQKMSGSWSALDGQRPERGRLQDQRLDVGGERAVVVVVLAVHVRADGPADRHLAGSRRHHRPEAERHQGPHQPVQADAGLDPGPAPSRSTARIRSRPVVTMTSPAGVLGRVAVAASQAAGDDPAVGRPA